MRIVGCLLAASVLLGIGLQTTLSQEPLADGTKTEVKSTRKFTVECRIAGKEKSMSLTLPTVTVADGEKKSFVDTGKKSVVIGNKPDNAGAPIKQEVDEGSTVEITVRENGDDEAILDFSLELSGNPAEGIAKQGQFRWITHKSRVIECVTLGEKTIAEFGGSDLEIVVKALPKSESEATNCQPQSTHKLASD